MSNDLSKALTPRMGAVIHRPDEPPVIVINDTCYTDMIPVAEIAPTITVLARTIEAGEKLVSRIESSLDLNDVRIKALEKQGLPFLTGQARGLRQATSTFRAAVEQYRVETHL